MQNNMTPITNPSFDTLYQKMLDLGASNPNIIKHYALAGDPTNPLMKIAATAALDKLSAPRPAPAQMPTGTVAENVVQQAGGIPALRQPMAPQMPPQMAPQMAPQMQAAPQMPPQMAPQMPEEGMAAGGLAELSIPDYMFDEQSYADGGIVAFEEGGEVPRFSGAYDPSLIEDPVMGYRKLMERRRAAQVSRKYPKGDKPEYEQAIRESTKTPYDEAINYYKTGLESLGPNASGRSPYLAGLKKLRGRQDAWLSGKADPITGEMPVGSKDNMYGTGPAKALDPSIQDTVDAAANFPTLRAGGAGAGVDITGAPVTKLDRADFIPAEASMADITQRQADAYEKAGVSADPYEQGIARLKPRREKLEREESQLNDDFLINTGLAMAANAQPRFGEATPSLFRTAALGATEGFARRNMASDKLLDRAEKLDDKEEALALAKNQFLQNRTDKNLARYETELDNRNKAQQSYAAESAKLEESGKDRTQRGNIAKMQESGANSRAAFAAQVQQAISQMDPAEVRAVKVYAKSKNIPYHEAVAEYYGFKSKKSEAELWKQFAALGGAASVGMDYESWKAEQGYSGSDVGGGVAPPKGTTVTKLPN